MRLVYLYVENPNKVLKKRGINFSSRYEIDIAHNPEAYPEKADYIFELKRKESYDDILYGPNTEVYGIVGNNGTGKSTVLDYIRRLHYDYENFMQEVGFALSIWEQNGAFYLCEKHTQSGSLPIHLYDYVTKQRIPFIHVSKVKSTTGMIYYSDIVDEKYVYNHFDENNINNYIFKEQKNVSTSYHLHAASDTQKRLRSHFQNEVGRELEFIGEVAEKHEELKKLYHIPNKIDMMIALTPFNKIEKKLKHPLPAYTKDYHEVSNGALQETSFITVVKLLKEEFTALKKMLIKMDKAALFHPFDRSMIEAVLQYNCILDILKHCMENAYSEISEELDEVCCQIVNEVIPAPSGRNLFGDDIYGIMEFNDLVLTTFCNSAYHYDANVYRQLQRNYLSFVLECPSQPYVEANQNQCILHIEVDTGKSYYMDSIIRLYREYSDLTYHNWMQFSWGMSSGEKSRVTLFSRFYDALKKEEPGDFLILLDELDYYMHPSWQQNILSEFIEFLNTMFSRHRFQIIFTTHSPITLSDVRKENILFLSSRVPKEEMEETFAANIAALYLSAFSMGKGSIGMIGSRVLNRMFSALNAVEELKECESLKERQSIFLAKYYENTKVKIADLNHELETRRLKELIGYIGEDIFRVKLLAKFENCRLLPSSNDNQMQEDIEQLIANYGLDQLINYFNRK